MKTTHDILRERLELQAGLFPPCEPAPTLPEIYKMQWSAEFERAMRDRMAQGYFRYGSLQAQIGKHPFDNIGSVLKRLSLYNRDGNREHLVDVANLCLVEFTVHPEKPFKAADDGHHTERKRR